ncbi:hypothetical protein HHI36_018434 [Cryptolaemus montrouzieri]|uniref:C2H2-type domain-containing protein n=1 Tax=Cryptolaemus montrouzieri TaxID=559131 RepID=A0ABD2P0X1_9CUCU
MPSVKPCKVELNEIKHLLDEDGVYIVSGRRFKRQTCYKCFQKFKCIEDLEIHKISHEEESEDEKDQLTDSDADIDSESDEEEDEEDDEAPNLKIKNVFSEAPKKMVAIVPVTPIMKPTYQRITHSVTNIGLDRKLPAINNIHIKCGTCELLFTNSDQLMQHTPVDPEKICSFSCKVCSENYSTPTTYMDHIMQHNAFTPRNIVVSIKPENSLRQEQTPKNYRYICVLCNSRFEDCYQLRRHEINVHRKKEEQVYQPNNKKICVIKEVTSLCPETKADDNKSSENKSESVEENSKRVETKSNIIKKDTKETMVENSIQKLQKQDSTSMLSEDVPIVRKRGRPPIRKFHHEGSDLNKSIPIVPIKRSIDQESSSISEKVSPPVKRRGRSTAYESNKSNVQHIPPTSNNEKSESMITKSKKSQNTVSKDKSKNEKEPCQEVITKKPIESISFNVLKDVEDSNIAISQPVAEESENFEVKTEPSLICDICFDVFTDAQFYEEHMVFHNNLEPNSDKPNVFNDMSIEEEDDVVIIGESLSIVQTVVQKDSMKTPNQEPNNPIILQQQINVKSTESEIDVLNSTKNDDDDSDILTIDEEADSFVEGDGKGVFEI